jgi:anti-sigma factor RsiW
MNNRTCIDPMDLQRLHDGELEPSRIRDVQLHLATCSECQSAIHSFADLGAALREAYAEVAVPDMTGRFVQRAKDTRDQGSRRIALGLLAAASVLFVSSLSLVLYTESGRAQGGNIMAQWEENVVWTPSTDDEFADPEAATLYAIHLQGDGEREDGND